MFETEPLHYQLVSPGHVSTQLAGDPHIMQTQVTCLPEDDLAAKGRLQATTLDAPWCFVGVVPHTFEALHLVALPGALALMQARLTILSLLTVFELAVHSQERQWALPRPQSRPQCAGVSVPYNRHRSVLRRHLPRWNKKCFLLRHRLSWAPAVAE